MTARPQSAPVLQTRLSAAPWLLPQGRRLPGTAMCDPDDWLRVDEAYAGQMALRDILLDRDPGAVWGETPGSRAAQRELLDIVLGWIAGRGGFALSGDTATRPDGARVRIDRDRPMQTLGRLVQQDLCLMQAGPGGRLRKTRAMRAPRSPPPCGSRGRCAGQTRLCRPSRSGATARISCQRGSSSRRSSRAV